MQAEKKIAVLVAIGGSHNVAETKEHLDELAFLAETAGIETIHRFIQNLPHPDSRTFVGKGKIEEIKNFVFANDVSYLIFDEDLSASQLRNIEREFNPKENEDRKVKIYDRSLLI